MTCYAPPCISRGGCSFLPKPQLRARPLPPTEADECAIGPLGRGVFGGDPFPPLLFERVDIPARRGVSGFFVGFGFEQWPGEGRGRWGGVLPVAVDEGHDVVRQYSGVVGEAVGVHDFANHPTEFPQGAGGAGLFVQFVQPDLE